MLEGSKVLTIASNDNVVFTERVDVVELAGTKMMFRINGIFEVRDGRIASWREYFDTCDMVQQLGMPLGFDPKRLYQT
jgi:limonene-1,2-epoxide hydrolase